MNNYRDFIAGGLSGVVEVTLTHWIDNIKTKIQDASIGNKKYQMKDININQLYQGYIPRIIGIIPMRLVFWGSQGIANNYCKDINVAKPYKLLLAGSICGLAQTTIDNPIEVMKVRLMTGAQNQSIWKVDYYCGVIPTGFRNIVFAAVFNLGVNYYDTKDHFKRFLQGAGAGLIASLLSHPFDVAKTAAQRYGGKKQKMLTFMVNQIKTNPKGLWSGCLSRCLLNCATMSVGYVSVRFILDHIISEF
jgi:hypothetical protein